MPIQVTMPRLSDTMQQGTIIKWNVKEGQKVKTGDPIADIETDKATMELQSFDDGTVAKLSVATGQQVPVGTLIYVLAAAGEDLAAAAASAGASTGAAKPIAAASGASSGGATATLAAPASNGSHAAASNGAGGRVFASPLAKKIASESGVNLSALAGSGPGGRIIRRDVEAALAAGGVSPAAIQPSTRATTAPTISVPAANAALVAKSVPLNNMRRVIATRLVESKQTIPHYQVTLEVDMDPLMSLRGQLNDQLASQGVKLSVNDFIVRACALAMHQHPYVNSRFVNKPGQEAIELLGQVNIGVAIALPEEKGGGLVVATVRNADNAGLRHISAESKRLSEKARTKGLSPDEMSDSTFTISNLGMFGVSHFTAIVNPPNVAILAVGAAIEKPVVKKGQIVVGHTMSMTMSSDHRVIDGAMAAQYLSTVKNFLENPATLLV